MTQPQTHIIEAADGSPRLHAFEFASPSPSPCTLVFVHGMGSHHGLWWPMLERFSEYRCVTYDCRGHGQSEGCERPAYSLRDHAVDIGRVVKRFGETERYILIGHSAGALAAAHFIASPKSSAMRPLCFGWIDIDPRVPDFQIEYFHQHASALARYHESRTVAIERTVGGIIRAHPGTDPAAVRQYVEGGLVEESKGWRAAVDPKTFSTWSPGDLRPDILPKIECPTVIVRGSRSIVSSSSGAQDLLKGIANARLFEFDNVGHFFPLEAPELLAQVLKDTLCKDTLVEMR